MNNLFKSKKIAVAPTKTTTISVPVIKKPTLLLSNDVSSKRPNDVRSSVSSARSSPAGSNARSSPATSASDGNEHSSRRLQIPKRKPNRQDSPSQRPKFDESDDEDEDATVEHPPSKRQRVECGVVDLKRQLRSRKAFSEEDCGSFDMIHAVDTYKKPRKIKIAEHVSTEDVIVELQYPSASQRERYDLRCGLYKDELNSAQEIINIARIVADVYLTDVEAQSFQGDSKGKLIRELERARYNLTIEYSQEKRLEFKRAVDNYNSAIMDLIQDGVLARNLDNRHAIPLSMVKLITEQAYDRTVSQSIEGHAKKVKPNSNEVYGELRAPLVDRIIGQTGLASNHVFVDLGSGVGNVVLHTALQVGCESWGCEIADYACKLARAQEKEFKARCRLWGIAPGKVQLEDGDFLENRPIKDAVKRADVILVNNEVFSQDLQQRLVILFLDCKDGCKIVSLKPFGSDDHKIRDYNSQNPGNVLDRQEYDFYSNDVSWTDGGGKYYIATKDSGRVAKFLGH